MSISKICLTAFNSKFIHSSLAVASLKKMCDVYADKLGLNRFQVITNEKTINDSFDSIAYSMLKEKADAYAFSVYIWNVQMVARVCKHIKAVNPKALIILGGPEVSYGIEHTQIDDNDFDYIISGEGERAFFSLLCELNGIGVPSGWNYSADGKIRWADNIESLAEIDLPYNEDNIHDYDDRIVYYESTRGCPFRCAYCLSSVCGKVRTLPVERVKTDIDFFIDHNVPQVKFVDRTFNCDKKRAVEIWKYIVSKNEESNTNFHFEIGADLLDDEELEILSKARKGSIQLELGIQSTLEEALDECCRHTDLEKLFSNVSRLVGFGNINVHVDLIAGLPYENFERFSQSFNETYKLKANQLQLGFLKLISGAPLNKMKEKHGYVFSEFSPYEIIKNNYISNDDIIELKRVEDVLERFYNSQRFSHTLEKAEKYFENPFEMFRKLADFFEKKSLTFKSVSTRVLYNSFKEFISFSKESFDYELLLDFITSERTDVFPSELKYLALRKDKSYEPIKESLKKNKKAQVRYIGNDAYIIDYSSRDAVSGTYKITEVFKNVCL